MFFLMLSVEKNLNGGLGLCISVELEMTRPNHVWVLSQKDHSIGWGLSYRYHTCEKLYCWILFSNNEKSISLLTFCSSGLSSTILLSQKVFICFVSKTFFNCLLWADHLLSSEKVTSACEYIVFIYVPTVRYVVYLCLHVFMKEAMKVYFLSMENVTWLSPASLFQ